MRERSDARADAVDDAVEQALTDHHLDEVAEMIERAQTEESPSESQFGDSAAGLLCGS